MRFRQAGMATTGLAAMGASLLCAVLSLAAAGQRGIRDSAAPTGRWQDASLEDYRRHLAALQALTQTCARTRDVKTCDPTLVGPDDRVPIDLASGRESRLVRYGWLRVLLYKADEPDKTEEAAGASERKRRESSGSDASSRPAPPTTSQLLRDAEARLTHDLAQASQPVAAETAHSAERDTMKEVLAGREFRGLQQATETDTVLEKLGNWLNHLFAGLGKLRARSAWVGRALVWAFFLSVAAVLTWRLLRLERRWRSRLVSPRRPAAPGAVSARDWQLWLADARRAAAEGRWREAIHFVYWASIARLEAKRLWPADRARTPREYLALMAPDDPRTAGLASLTQSFERTWYGGREAGESDYRRAELMASELIGSGLAESEAG